MSKNNLYSIEDIRKAYDAVQNHVRARQLITCYSVNREDIRDRALSGLDMTGVESVLDLGCAYGFFAEKLAGRLQEGASIEGIDLIDKTNRELFLNAVDLMGYRGRFTVGSADLIKNMAGNSFDLVAASYSLYFFPHLIGEIARILRPNGVFITITHSEFSLQEVIRFIPRCIRSIGLEALGEPAIRKLLQVFSLENGEKWLKGHFGKIEKIVFKNALSFPLDNEDDCIDYLEKKKNLLFKEIFETAPQRVEEVLSSFYHDIRESARERGTVVITKDDCVFRCFEPRA
jgi:SAM-dependent methyltransferase